MFPSETGILAVPLTADDSDGRDTRFHGLKQECGLHLPQTPEEEKSLNSSFL